MMKDRENDGDVKGKGIFYFGVWEFFYSLRSMEVNIIILFDINVVKIKMVFFLFIDFILK